MDFSLSEEQQMLRQAARAFLAEKCPKTLVKSMEQDEFGYPPELWREIVGLGWTGLVFPEQYGGSAMGFLDLAVLLEETGRACLPAPLFPTVVLGGMPILEFGTQEQKDEYLPGIISGNMILTLALIEPDGLYDPDSISTTARRETDSFVLNGTKLFVPDANAASSLLCAARTDCGLSVFMVGTQTPGLTMNPLSTLAGDKLFEVHFDEVRIPRTSVLGLLEKGHTVIGRTVTRAALARCCEMLGAMQQVLEMTVAYAKERQQFAHPIGSFQAIQHYCSRMAADVEGARSGVYRAAWMMGEGLSCAKEVSIAKAFVNEASRRVVALAHQIHGAIGITMDHDLHYYTRRLKAAQLTFGDADFHYEVVAVHMGFR